MKDTVINYTNLNELLVLKKKNPKLALKKVCKEFESLMWYEILKGLDKTIIKSGFFKEDLQYKIFKDYLYQEIGRKISDATNGLGEYLYKALLKTAYFKNLEKNPDKK